MDDIKALAAEASALASKAAEMQEQASQALLDAASRLTRVQEILTKPVERPPGKGWGPGPLSGLPWHSGARCQNDSAVAGFVAAGRPGRPCDIIQCFNGREQASDWNDVAGGKDDSLTAFDGTMSLTKGQKGAHHIWRAHPELDAVFTVRPIPQTESNRGGRNPRVWERIAGGEFNWAFRRQGRKLAGLDAQFPRRGRLILEIAREMTGEWDQHSIVGAQQWFPGAWAKIVSAMRAGYREASGRDMPHLIWFRPARSPVANGVWTEAILPPAETWDGIGLSQHDNGWAPCTPADPHLNWRRYKNAEGLDNIAEIADRLGKLLGIWEWSSHHEDADNDSGPHPGIFTQSMYDWFNREDIRKMLAGETYFLCSVTTFAGNLTWEGTKAYRRLWGAAA